MQILLIIFIFFTTGISENLYLLNNLTFGYDSNPMKLSESDIDDSNNDLFLDKYNIDTKHLKINSKLKTSIKFFKWKNKFLKRKAKIGISLKLNHYLDLKEKSNYGIYLNLNQPIGNYRNIKIDYTYIPDIFLREYDDADIIHQYYNFINPATGKCYFDLSKLTFSYIFPIKDKKNKLRISYYKEKQFYNEHFTEFDLDINGYKVYWLGENNLNKYNVSLLYNIAENLTFLNGNLSTSEMDRGYYEVGYRLSFERKIKKIDLKIIYDRKNRKYSSNIIDDELHYNRNHIDCTLSTSFKFKIKKLSQKINLSYRKRDTESPENWVVDIKTFKRYDLSYTVYLKKITFRD